VRGRYNIWLDGWSLEEVDPSVWVVDVREHAPDIQHAACGNARYDGQRLLRSTRLGLSVTAHVVIRERNAWRRSEVLARVKAWGQGAKRLALSTRPGQVLHVEEMQLADPVSALKWTQELRLTWTAWALPFWQEEQRIGTTAQGMQGELLLSPAGTLPCPLEAKITYAGAEALSSVRLTCGEQMMELAGMQLTGPATVEIAYDEAGLLRMPFGHRTAESCDDIWLEPGRINRIAFTADRPVTVMVYARGRSE